MSDLVFYRKYRPAVFSDFIGQEMVVKILKEAARQNRLAHAYLLAGPRGTGKTTIARLIAKIANCANRDHVAKIGEPCDKCGACSAINGGSALDVIEIDAASNRGIDEIRNLKEHVRIAPSSLPHKVFIIDEAHMLTKEAANALLKTLEEPPSCVIIILATTERDKIPRTIASRAQIFQFKRVPLKHIVKKLEIIAKAENLRIGQSTIELIAASAEGSFRDAESLLDQMAAMTHGEITAADIENTLGAAGFQKIAKLAGCIFQNDLQQALALLHDIQDEGQNLVELTKDLIIHLRRTAVLNADPDFKAKLENELMESQISQIETHSALFQPRHLEIIKSLITAYSQMRYSQFPIIPLEIALIENLK